MFNRSIEEMITYFGSDARRINHAIKVYGFSEAIAAAEHISVQDSITLSLAAVFHDIGIVEAERKHSSTAGRFQEMEGPLVARPILEGMGIEPAVTERVCYLIGNHHSYQKIDGVDFQILVEADFLVNIFEDDMDREAAMSVRDKYFRTTTGIKLLECMYLH